MPAPVKVSVVRIPDGSAVLDGDLHIPDSCIGLVVFAHGSGSSRFSPRNRQVAAALASAGCATLLLDLLTKEEEAADVSTRAIPVRHPSSRASRDGRCQLGICGP